VSLQNQALVLDQPRDLRLAKSKGLSLTSRDPLLPFLWDPTRFFTHIAFGEGARHLPICLSFSLLKMSSGLQQELEKSSPEAAVYTDAELSGDPTQDSLHLGTADDQHNMYRLGKEQKFRVSEDLPPPR
jgi:hypothetical protein